MKKHELKAAIAKASEELQAMAGKSTDEGYKQELYDALKETMIELNKQLGRVEEAEKIVARSLTPVQGQDRQFAMAPPSAYKLYGTLKNFKDREISGRMARGIDQAFTAGQWFRATLFGNEEAKEWCRANGIPMQKAQGEGVDQAGGFLVPEELMQTIIVLREEFGYFRKVVRIVPMGRDTLNIPRRSGGLTASFTGENQAITASQAGWDNINLTAKKLGCLAPFSTEIAEDAVVSIADWLVQEIAYAFASKEDDCGFNGDGTSAYGGIRGFMTLGVDANHTAGAFQVSSATLSSLVSTDFTATMGLLPRYAIGNASWYMSQQMFFLAVANVMVKNGGGNTTNTIAEALKERLLGFPVGISQKLPLVTPGSGKAMWAFGDLTKAAMMGERRGVTIARSEHRYFENDQIAIRGTERFDINIHDMGDNTTAGPLVVAKSP